LPFGGKVGRRRFSKPGCFNNRAFFVLYFSKPEARNLRFPEITNLVQLSPNFNSLAMKKIMLFLVCAFIFLSCENQQTADNTSNKAENDTDITVADTTAVVEQIQKLDEVKSYADFYRGLQVLVKENNKNAIADFIQFPLHTVKDRKTFLQDYDSIFTPVVKDSLFAANLDSLFTNYKGSMIGNGQIWVGEFDSIPHYRIIGINY
ncbi:MAG: hypothetical protein ACEPOW_08160, partial [Bacteroidales bacterium]